MAVSIRNAGRRLLTYRDMDAFRFLTYWYFRDTIYQARTYEHSCVMARRCLLNEDIVISKEARSSLFEMTPGIRADHLAGLDGKPMVHHYSWVRTKD